MLRPILTVAMVLSCASAAGAQGRSELLLSDAPRPPFRRCAILDRLTPEQVGALDPAALRRAISADPALPREGTVLYSVVVDERGVVRWLRPIETTLSEAAEERVREIVRAGVRAGPAEESWGFRVRVTLGETPEARIGRSERCEIRLERRAETVTRMAGLSGTDDHEVRSAGQARIRVRVRPDGTVSDVRVERSSGSRVRDNMAMDVARESVWLPALHDGFPVDDSTVWYSSLDAR